MIDLVRVRSLARTPRPERAKCKVSEPEPQPRKENPNVPSPSVNSHKKIIMKGVKVTTLVPPACLVGLVPPEPEPAGNPVLDIEIEGSSPPVVIRATLNGKSIRRACKVIAEHGTEGVNALLQGNLRPGANPGEPFALDAAGLTVTPRVAKPGEPTA